MNWKDLVPWRSSESKLPVRREDHPFTSLQREVDRLFDNFTSAFPFSQENLWGDSDGFSPRVNVEESEKELRIKAEVPGLEEKDISLSLIDDYLTIRGEKKHEEKRKDKGASYFECSYGSFQRVIPLGFEVVTDEIDASLKKGVLTVRLPKSEKAQRQKRLISIRTE
jgi:HSP20 family protein